MTVKEKLLQELECSINAVLGDNADKEYGKEYKVEEEEIDLIARKVKFYLEVI